MNKDYWRRCVGVTVASAAVLLVCPALARGQSGPLTESLVLEEPKTFSFRIGPLLVSPNLTIREFGIDSNVFNESENPKKDWTISVTPDLRMFARLGLVQVVGLASNDFRYYQKYASERGIARQFRGRIDAQLSRFHPWLSAAHVDMRARPNREIDLRTRSTGKEVSAGISFNISPIAGIYAMATRSDNTFEEGQEFRDVDLASALSRRSEGVSGGLKIRATPFTTVLLSGTIRDDGFAADPQRDTRSRSAEARFEFSPEAILRGKAMIGYQDFRPDDPVIPAFHGLVSSGGLTYTLLGRATVETNILREVTYSYDINDAYYVETGLNISYTQLLTGPYDVQFGAYRSWLDYTRTTPGFKPALDAFQAGVGYNFQDKSRFGLIFEYSQRIDKERPDRRYHNRRFFASYTQELAR